MKQQNRHISNFRTFESKEEFISIDDIKEIFIELIDKGYEIKSHSKKLDNSRRGDTSGKYFFEFNKSLSKESIGYFDKGLAYGCSNINVIKKEFDIFDTLEDAKESLKSMGYTIGFEFEFNLTSTSDSILKIICHMQHSKFDITGSEDNGMDGFGDMEEDDEQFLRETDLDSLERLELIDWIIEHDDEMNDEDFEGYSEDQLIVLAYDIYNHTDKRT